MDAVTAKALRDQDDLIVALQRRLSHLERNTESPLVLPVGAGGTGAITAAAALTALGAAASADFPATAWAAYTPTWISNVAPDPTVGNGSLVGAYARLGKTVSFRMVLTIGSTTGLGGGSWKFGLPLPAVSTANVFAGLILQSGVRWFTDVTPNTASALSTTVFEVYLSGGTQQTSPTTPISWAAGDQLIVCGVYEGA